jgi:hypothetical protein
MTGKILFFNATDGKGIIITSDKKKLSFEVGEWDDFDVMPSLGLEVAFDLNNNTPIAIASIENYVKHEETQDIDALEDAPSESEEETEEEEEQEEQEE